MVDAMRAMLDELMGEDRDGDREKYAAFADRAVHLISLPLRGLQS